MNKVSFKQLTAVVAFIGLGFSAVDAGAVSGTITGQLVNAKTGDLVCAEALINGSYRTYTCTTDGLNRGAPFTLPYEYIQGSTDTSANKLLLFASGYAPEELTITEANQSVRVQMTKITDLDQSSRNTLVGKWTMINDSGTVVNGTIIPFEIVTDNGSAVTAFYYDGVGTDHIDAIYECQGCKTLTYSMSRTVTRYGNTCIKNTTGTWKIISNNLILNTRGEEGGNGCGSNPASFAKYLVRQ